MRFSSALAIGMIAATSAMAQSGLHQPYLVTPGDSDSASWYAASTQTAETLPSGVAQTSFDDAAAPAADSSSACGCDSAPSCGCEPSCGCDNGCCSSGCGCNDGCSLFGDCCLGDAWTLKSCYDPCGCCEHTVGGWIAAGYYNNNERLSATSGDGLAFLDYPDHLNLDQAWVYAEKLAEAGACSADWGYRFDMMYGVDAQKTQAFGNDDNVWDVSFDNGPYGWAMPQAYAEVAMGDWSVKVGHFFTIIGYEVVQATGNFFYSHSYTMFNSEPFTHTGVLGTYSASDETTIYAGWTLGWDTGFDQANGGSNWLGGISHTFGEDVTVTYASTAGNFGLRSAGGSGYNQSVVAVADLSDKTQYVFQTDYTTTNGYLGDPDFDNNEYGINQYLFYTVNDCSKLGGRMEWWKSNGVTGESTSFYEVTGGVNYKPHANVVVRPEIRYNWTPAETTVNPNFNNTVFAIDAVVTF
jgi:hypothetical protein